MYSIGCASNMSRVSLRILLVLLLSGWNEVFDEFSASNRTFQCNSLWVHFSAMRTTRHQRDERIWLVHVQAHLTTFYYTHHLLEGVNDEGWRAYKQCDKQTVLKPFSRLLWHANVQKRFFLDEKSKTSLDYAKDIRMQQKHKKNGRYTQCAGKNLRWGSFVSQSECRMLQ